MEGRILASRYRLLQLLGKGGMGTVWRAQHLELGAQVAIKLMDPELAANADWLARFRREAQAAASLHSPNIVNVFDFGVDEESPYIAMELLHGETLAQRLAREKRLAPAEAVTILQQVARAVAKAHDAGIAHRDLKPENVFLVRDDDLEIAKVLDFGIAKRTNITGETTGFVRTETGAMLGTPLYMSPEQAAGKKNIDHLTDIWSFGVIACECLIGARIFNADTLGGLVLAICSEPIPRPSESGFVTPQFDTWFFRCVARDRAQRFQSIREAAAALIQSISGRSVPPVNPVEPTSTNPDPQQASQPPEGARAEGLNRIAAPSAASSAAPAAREPSAGLPAIVEGVSTAVFLDPTATGASVAPNFAVTAPPVDPKPRHGAITRRRTVAGAAMATIGAAAGVLWFVIRDPSDATPANALSSPPQMPQTPPLLAPANLAEPSRAKVEPSTELKANAASAHSAPEPPASDVVSAIEANVAASAHSAPEPPASRVEWIELPQAKGAARAARTTPRGVPLTSPSRATPPSAPPKSAIPAQPSSTPASQSASRSRPKIDLAL